MVCLKTENTNGNIAIYIAEIYRYIVWYYRMKGMWNPCTLFYRSFNQSWKNMANTYSLHQFQIIAVGITTVSKPIDKFIRKIFRGCYRGYFDSYMLSAPVNHEGQIFTPSQQLRVQWVSNTWDNVIESILKETRKACGNNYMEIFWICSILSICFT